MNVKNEIQNEFQQLKRADLRPVRLIFLATSLILLIAILYSALNGHFPVTHNAAVPGNSNYPESYTIAISPALTFAMTWSFWRVLGLIVWLAFGVYLVAVSNDLLGKNEGTFGSFLAKHPVLVSLSLMLITVVMVFVSYSNKVAGNNTVTIDPVRYEMIKDNKDSIKALFHKKDLY